MKKLLIFILVSFGALSANAQNPTFAPATFTAEDQVTLTVDVTGTNMVGATEAYIWMWSNPDLPNPPGPAGNDGITNTAWSNSPDIAKMTSAGGNKWKFTFTGTAIFGRSPAELKSFAFLVKKKDGSAQTPDFKPFNFDPLVFTPTMLRVFPSKAGIEDVVTLNFDKTYAVTTNEQRMTPTSVTITAWDEQTSPSMQIGNALTIPLTKKDATIWNASFIPVNNFTAPPGRKLYKIKYKFNGTLLDPNGAPVNVSSSETEYVFSVLH